MDISSFFTKDFVIDGIEVEDSSINLNISFSSKFSTCPKCGVKSERVHSRYTRTIHDLIAFGKIVVIQLFSRKFFCENPSCSRSIFTERFETLIKPYSRRTERLNEALVKFAFSLSSEAASRISKYIFPHLSTDTFIRIIRKEQIEVNTSYKYIGIDDWAFRKGLTYGTLICDLETHRPIDVLKDRTTKTLADWLENHRDIEIVTRDRANAYSKAVDDTLPSAVQIADKWHLLKNMSGGLNSILQSQYTKGVTLENTQVTKEESLTNVKPTQQEIQRQLRISKSMALIQETKRLHADGVKQKEISTLLGISRKTIYRYLRRSEPTYSSAKDRGSILDDYRKEIDELFIIGTNPRDILAHVRESGYIGCESLLRMYLSKLNKFKMASNNKIIVLKSLLSVKSCLSYFGEIMMI